MAERIRVRVRKKKNKRKIIFKRIVLLFLLLIVGAGAFAGYKLFNTIYAVDRTYDELERGDKSKLRENVVEINQEPFSILFMGIENYSTGGEDGHSDSLILATLDPKSKSMKMMSIPRDTRTEIAGQNGLTTKITHAYNYGGKEATIETVEDLFDIPIDYYATVDFSGFKDVVNEMGGIEVDVPFDFTEKSDVSKNKSLEFTEGPMHLNGEEALAFARMRKQDPRGDFGRNDRQKQVIAAAIDQMSKPQNLSNIDNITSAASKNIETNIRITQALGLHRIYSGFKSENIESLTLEGSDVYLPNSSGQNVYYFEPDADKLQTLSTTLRQHLKMEGETTGTASEKESKSEDNSTGSDSSSSNS